MTKVRMTRSGESLRGNWSDVLPSFPNSVWERKCQRRNAAVRSGARPGVPTLFRRFPVPASRRQRGNGVAKTSAFPNRSLGTRGTRGNEEYEGKLCFGTQVSAKLYSGNGGRPKSPRHL